MSLGSPPCLRRASRYGTGLIVLIALLAVLAPGLAHADCLGTRYVALTGTDAGNSCAVPSAPCRTIQHAIDATCDGETVAVATGDYTEDILIDHPITVHGPPEGPIGLHITGTGTVDVVRILSSNVTFSGMTVWNTPGRVGIRVGDATHTGLRGIVLQNATSRNNGIGFVLESTGSTGAYNVLSGAIARNCTATGQPDGGTGFLLIGGNGRVQMLGVLVHHNDGSGVRIAAPPPGGDNTRYVIVGSQFWNNGIGPAADGVAGIEAHEVVDLSLEASEFYGHTGPGLADDGMALFLDGVSGGGIACNRVHDNEGGLVLAGGTSGLDLQSNAFLANSGTAVSVDASSIAGNALHESVFQGNGSALVVQGTAAFDAGHSWWGAASGPSGAFPGTGDAVDGPVSLAPLVAGATAPTLARIQTEGNWDFGISACHPSMQEAVDAAAPGTTILAGTGPFYEHVVVAKPLTIEGIPGGTGCSPSAVDGYQGSAQHAPALRATGVTGLVLRDLTLQNAAHGAPCGVDSGDEIGLDLQNVQASTISNLCLRGNGITELRLYGDSDGNVLQNLDIDGTTAPDGGQACDHLSRDGVLVDGGPACEGGPGASADGNQVLGAKIRGVTLGARIRLATGTVVSGGSIQARTTPEWNGGSFAAGVTIEAANTTEIRGCAVGNPGMNEAIRIAGRPTSACYSVPTDSLGTVVDGNVLADVSGVAVHLHRAPGDPGAPAGAVVSCNEIRFNGTGVVADDTGAGAGAPARVFRNDLHGNGLGMVDATVAALAAASNWWGAPSGPSGAGPGAGDGVSAERDLLPVPGRASHGGPGRRRGEPLPGRLQRRRRGRPPRRARDLQRCGRRLRRQRRQRPPPRGRARARGDPPGRERQPRLDCPGRSHRLRHRARQDRGAARSTPATTRRSASPASARRSRACR